MPIYQPSMTAYHDVPVRGASDGVKALNVRQPEDSTVPARFWHALPDGRFQCDLCPRFCKLHDGQRGLCFVRARQGDRMVLTTYGRSSGFCVDPIEKKPLNHFLPGSAVLSFGTAGCNLACRFCQNWDISKSREVQTLADAASPLAIAAAAERLGCRGVAFTYNDPVIFHEYAIDVADACRVRGIQSVAVTAGYVCPEPRAEFYRHMDAANVDLKGFTERFYDRACSGHLQPVLDTPTQTKNISDNFVGLLTRQHKVRHAHVRRSKEDAKGCFGRRRVIGDGEEGRDTRSRCEPLILGDNMTMGAPSLCQDPTGRDLGCTFSRHQIGRYYQSDRKHESGKLARDHDGTPSSVVKTP